MDKVHKKHYIPSPMFGPYTFINVSVGKEEGDDDGHSKKNAVEVAVVIKIIEKLYKGILILEISNPFGSFCWVKTNHMRILKV